MAAPPRPRRRTRLAKGDRREQLLAAAERAFLRGGYHGTHVDDVIREAGIARGTFYLHFESKHAIFAALVERMLALFLEARPATPEPEIRNVADAEALLRLSTRTVLETFRAHRGLCRLLLEEAVGADKGFAARLAAHEREWHARVADTRREFVERGIARADLDCDVHAEMVIGIMERITRQYLLPDAEPDIGALVEAVVALELRGLCG